MKYSNHKMSKHPFYLRWKDMKARCNCPTNCCYSRYGGRGIKVCERWSGINGFLNFKTDMYGTYKYDLSLDRINNNGDYSPENCRWVDAKIQSNNTRNNRNFTYNGETLTLTRWSEKLDINKHTISSYKTLHINKIFAWMELNNYQVFAQNESDTVFVRYPQ